MGSPRYSGINKGLAVCLRTFGYAEPASNGSIAARPRTRGSCKGKPPSLRASCLLFGGRVFEKPLLFPPDAHHCECRQNSQRDFGEAMRRSNPWRLCARNHHDDRQRDAGVAIADLFQAKHKRYQPEKMRPRLARLRPAASMVCP